MLGDFLLLSFVVTLDHDGQYWGRISFWGCTSSFSNNVIKLLFLKMFVVGNICLPNGIISLQWKYEKQTELAG